MLILLAIQVILRFFTLLQAQGAVAVAVAELVQLAEQVVLVAAAGFCLARRVQHLLLGKAIQAEPGLTAIHIQEAVVAALAALGLQEAEIIPAGTVV